MFEDLKARVDPQIVFTHAGYDLHQDHRLACELTWNTFRNHLILEYEIPKFDGDLGRPNVFVPLTQAIVRGEGRAARASTSPSQRGKHWFDRETFLGLMRLRGMESVAPERFAEAFTCRKVVRRSVRFVPLETRRRVTRRARAYRGRARLLRPDVVRRRVRGARPRIRARPVQPLAQHARRHACAGLHFQTAPHEEAKLVRCTRGAIFDVIVDLRPDSATHTSEWVGVELDADRGDGALRARRASRTAFRRSSDDTEVLYMISTPYVAGGVERGALGRPRVRDRVAGGGLAHAERPRPELARLRLGQPPDAGHVEIVAADLLDPREQLVDARPARAPAAR